MPHETDLDPPVQASRGLSQSTRLMVAQKAATEHVELFLLKNERWLLYFLEELRIELWVGDTMTADVPSLPAQCVSTEERRHYRESCGGIDSLVEAVMMAEDHSE